MDSTQRHYIYMGVTALGAGVIRFRDKGTSLHAQDTRMQHVQSISAHI
jgi:hypothetical protein